MGIFGSSKGKSTLSRDECLDQTALSMLRILNDLCTDDSESRIRSKGIVPIITVASLRGRVNYDTALDFRENLRKEIFPTMDFDYSEAFDEGKYWIIYGPLNESGSKWLERLSMQLIRIVEDVRRKRDFLEMEAVAHERSLTLLRHDLFAGLQEGERHALDHEFLAELLSKSFSTQLVEIWSEIGDVPNKTTDQRIAALCNFHSLVTNLFVLQSVVEH
jgi:hypothetical protein